MGVRTRLYLTHLNDGDGIERQIRCVTKSMNVTLLKGPVALVPACMLFSGSMVLFLREKTISSSLQLIGSGYFMVVVLTRIGEALNLFPRMLWGFEHTAGHYLDLGSAVLGLTLFPVGYLIHVLIKHPA